MTEGDKNMDTDQEGEEKKQLSDWMSSCVRNLEVKSAEEHLP